MVQWFQQNSIRGFICAVLILAVFFGQQQDFHAHRSHDQHQTLIPVESLYLSETSTDIPSGAPHHHQDSSGFHLHNLSTLDHSSTVIDQGDERPAYQKLKLFEFLIFFIVLLLPVVRKILQYQTVQHVVYIYCFLHRIRPPLRAPPAI